MGSRPEEGEYLQGFQRAPRAVKKRLIVHGAAAVVFARVLRVVGGGVGAGPAGAVLLPFPAVFRPAAASGADINS